ncbi:hypothetical protein HDV04_004558 [Boothiomyces sp. JEL0838]|nr:hypothetical protein HDV04_004558 [Boothiomyces sp. JEL0838]
MVEAKYVFAGLLVAAVGYGVYFDYQRRNNPAFRKKLAKQRKEAAKIKQQQPKAASNSPFAIPEEPIPTTNEGREQYFMRNLQAGEQLLQQGPMAFDAAATCFYRALQVYPEPQKLLEVLAQSLPEVIMNMIIQKMADDVRAAQGASIVEEVTRKQDEYYKIYPHKEMNVQIHQEIRGGKVVRRGLLVTKDVKAGETIFKEMPIATSTQENLKGKGYCVQCFGQAESSDTCPVCSLEFCSETCISDCKYHSVLCTKDSESPAFKLQRFLKAVNKVNNRLALNFLLNMIEKEMQITHNTPAYSEWDVTLEKYVSIKSKMEYNSISIPLKDDAVVYSLATEDCGRGNVNGQDLKGVGLYHIASIVSHSCRPNVEFRFNDNSELSIVALTDLARETELLACYVPMAGDRRNAIKARYGFECKCDLCKSE